MVLLKLIANSLSWWLEEHSALCPWQAGFSKRRSATVQCLRLSQIISDGLQSTERRRTIATFFDVSLAYDRVLRTGHLMKTPRLDVFRRSTEWLSYWFIYRTARVRVNGSICPSRTFKEGLPQSSAIYPLLFKIYANDLQTELKNDTFVSAYDDDPLIARSVRKKALLQPEVDKVVFWSDKARLTLSTSKCETAFFNLNCAEAAWQTNITIDEKRILQFLADFLGGQVRPTARLWRAFAKALPIDVRPYPPPPCSLRHEMRMAYFEVSSGLFCDRAQNA